MQFQGPCLCRKYTLHIILFIAIFSLAFRINAQQIENLYLEPFGDKIIIHYDFITNNAGVSYQLKVFQSIDGFDKAINLVKGDIGESIIPGKGKVIEWYAREELGTYKGAIRIEIRIYESPTLIYIQHPSVGTKLKRGSNLNIRWNGGIDEDKISIHLFNNGKKAEIIAENIDNEGHFSWETSNKMKPGNNYSIEISGGSTKDLQSSSGAFLIKRKVPIWLMVAPLVLVGTATAVIINSSKTESSKTDLPAAPDPN